MYAKERPNSCVTDVSKGLEFELTLGYQDLNCDVKQEAAGKFFSEVVIQVINTNSRLLLESLPQFSLKIHPLFKSKISWSAINERNGNQGDYEKES